MILAIAALVAGASFSCTPAQVWDGDTFTCADGIKVRVAGIAVREIRVGKDREAEKLK